VVVGGVLRAKVRKEEPWAFVVKARGLKRIGRG